MYQAPEVDHLLRAVKAVKRAIGTQKKTEPEPEEETESDSGEVEEQEHKR